MDDISSRIAPCVRGVLVEHYVPALGVLGVVQRGLSWEDGAFEALLDEGLALADFG